MLFPRTLARSVRALVRAPGFSMAVIMVLGLGIAANTIIFVLVDQLLLNPFPYRQPERLVMIWEANPARGGIQGKRAPVAWANFTAWQAENHSFEAMEAYEPFIGFNLTGRSVPEHLIAARATPGFFKMLGVNAAQGRTFAPGDDTPNSSSPVVVTHAFAKKHFGDQNPSGERLLLDGVPYTIVGVLPKDFHLPAFFEGISEYKPDIWLALPKLSSTDGANIGRSRRLVVWGRLKPGVTLEQARADMSAVAQQRAQEDAILNQGYSVNVFPLSVENTLPDFRDDLRLFSVAGIVVLLLACSNLAGLMLVRMAARKKNLAVMAALGANRWALILPVLTESMVLAVASGLLGFMLSFGGVRLIAALKPRDIHGPERLTMNVHAFVFAAIVSMLTVLIFGLIPGQLTTRNDLTEVLKANVSGYGRRSYVQRGLIAIQIAACLSLGITSILLVRSFRHVLGIDLGFKPQQVLTAHLTLPPQRYPDSPARLRFCQELEGKLRQLPGVQSVALVDYMPLTAIRVTPFEIEGRAQPGRNSAPYADFADVTPEFFSAMGIALRNGRVFTEDDAQANPPNVVIVNEAMARQFWPNQDSIGSHVRRLSPSGTPAGPWQTVVGVVQDFRQFNVETSARPELLFPGKSFSEMTVLLRTANSSPLSLSSPLQQAVWSLDHDQPLSDVQTLQQIVGDLNSQRRFNMLAIGLFAGFSVLLTVVGLYGLVASFIASRLREIGIRFALGARQMQVCFALLRPVAAPVIGGVGLGLILSFSAKRLIESVVFGISAVDAATYTLAPLILIMILLLTSLAASLKAARIEPVRVLREE